MKHLTIAFLPIPLLFGCNAFQGNQPLNEPDRNNIQNVRYNPDDDDMRDNRMDVNNFDHNDVNNADRNGVNDVDRNVDNENRMEVADKAADRVADLAEVNTANVIVTNRNAYAAVVLKDGAAGKVTNRLEEKIAGEVRAADPDIRNVYVSTNPDFVDRMTDYGDRINAGDPVEGFFEEFNETVRRVFPNPR
ncbi:YhcN/YlaJ family sporulation lipoprotein [Bacillus aerolatus]|uniref:YhcN/YlaJ family sporulation lipoprotein n=2 Tax=Bacillus aerolatus TaxID=2653354 RepID=A0A6I1FJJ0_9BACI|nr:YhcN/YlaJ family sporulation lipoprotein [Bacillus aerolatus]KAB7706016.1 YhcN/YlaJ family sporulation lipoprotein [Bacillus aerolatus]